MKTLVCPHCGTHVPEHATVCVGCGAEIVHGATRKERSSAGCLLSFVALIVTMAIIGMGKMPEPSSDAAFLLILKFIILVVVTNAIGRIGMRWLCRSKLRFFRKTEDL